MHETIAAGMGPRDRAMLACSHPTLRDSLRAFSISDTAAVQGGYVDSLGELRDVLQDVRSLPERPDLQARPLAVLAGRLGALPDGRVPAFDDILATITQAPAGHRRPMDVPLMMLAGQVALLESAEQAGAFQRLLQAQEPPGWQAEGLHLLAGRNGDLPEAAGQQAVTQVLRWAERLEPGPAKELVEQIEDLPEAARGPAFSGLLQACSSLAPEQRTVRLEALADRSGWLLEPVRSQAVRGVLAAAEPLAPEQRWAVLKPLSQQVYLLPNAEQLSIWRAIVHSFLVVPPGQLTAALAALIHQIRTLRNAGDEQQLAVPLIPALVQESLAWLQRGEDLPPQACTTLAVALALGLSHLPLAERQAGFQQALHSVRLLREEHRGALVREVAKAIAALPEAARQPAWQATLQAVEQLQPQQGAYLFATLAAQMGGLPMDAQAAAFESVLQAHRRLPVGCHALSVDALGTGCLALPRAQWPHVLDRVLVESARLPGQLQRLSVLELAIKFCLAEPAANGPIGPPQPDNPRLDIRLQCLGKVLESMPPQPHPPEEFLESVNVLSNEVEQRLQQRPDDAAFLTEALGRIRRFRGA